MALTISYNRKLEANIWSRKLVSSPEPRHALHGATASIPWLCVRAHVVMEDPATTFFKALSEGSRFLGPSILFSTVQSSCPSQSMVVLPPCFKVQMVFF